MQQISKNEILKLLKQYNINEASKNDYLDGSIEVNIKFGNQKMNKQPTIRELILNVASEVKEMKSDMQVIKSDIKHINGRLDNIEDRLDNIEVRLDHVEEQQKKMKNDIQIMKSDIQQIKNCPTIKKELTV